MKKLALIYLLLAFSALNGYAQETLETVTSRGNVAARSLQIGGGYVNANTTKLFINNPLGKNWAVSSGANQIDESGFHIYNWTDNNIQPFFSIWNNGYVGVGITNPTSKLDVSGAIKSYNVALGQYDIATSSKNYVNFSSNNHGTVLVSSNLYMSENDDLKIAKSHPSMAGASILIPGNSRENQGGIIFYTNSPAPVSENQAFTGRAAMLIKSDGNVGIGTTSPKEKLSVNGKIRAHEVKVETANWPDYVFNQDYKMLGLQELDAYIRVHKHLPEMPSAKEVEANGMALGELVKLQQKKIEELTLHLIEKDKALSDTQKKLTQLTEAHQKSDLINTAVLKRLAEAEKNIKAINPNN